MDDHMQSEIQPGSLCPPEAYVPTPLQGDLPQTEHKSNAYPKKGGHSLPVLLIALLLIAASLALHTSLLAMGILRLRASDPALLLTRQILPGFTSVLPEQEAPAAPKPETPQKTEADTTAAEPPSGDESSESAPPGDVETRDLSANAENGFALVNQTTYAPDLWALYSGAHHLPTAETLRKKYGADAPLVLILHTHGTESYAERSADGFRSRAPEESVVAVGDVITEVLERAGIPVLHLREMFDKDDWSAAYDKSSSAVKAALEKYPSIQYIFDVHRDSIGGGSGGYVRSYAECGGTATAQLMLVCGTDEGGSAHTAWRDNLAFALTLQAGLHGVCDDLMRPVNLRTASFYQDLRKGSLLLEVGTSANSLSEAKRAGAVFAAALASYVLGEDCGMDPETLAAEY